MKRLFSIVTIALLWPVVTSAATPYYEFSPDYVQSMLVASSETVSEVFLPLNDFLGSLDFWVSNNSTAGDAIFTLYNNAGTQLTSTTVSVPAIADSESGTRLHVNLPSQISVVGSNTYRVSVTTAIPYFRLYYGDATKLLAHNGAPLPLYTGGLARIGDEDKGFSFKFALYESHETAPPHLSNIAVAQPSLSQAVLSWNANEPVDRRVVYGASAADWTEEYSSCVNGIQNCSALLNVTPGEEYSYTLTVRDIWGNTAQSSGTFTALGQGQPPTPSTSTTPIPTVTITPTATVTPTPSSTPDTSTPVITNVRAVEATASSVGLAWTTNKTTDSSVVVQLLPYFIHAGAGGDATLELEHFVTIAGLDSDTDYIARITSTDAFGTSTVASLNFKTTSIAATATPTTGSPTPAATITGSPANPEIIWQPPAKQPSDGYRVDVFDAHNNLVKTMSVPAGQQQAALGALPEGQHRIVVYAADDGVFKKITTQTTSRPTSTLETLATWAPYGLLSIIIVSGVVILILKHRTKKPPTTPTVTPPETPPVTGVTSQP